MPIASSFVDACRFNPTLGGTTDWTPSTAVTGFQLPSAAGVITNAQYSFRAESLDLAQWEECIGIWDGSKFVRTTVTANNLGTTAKINFTAVPTVAVVALSQDLRDFGPPQGRLTLAAATPVMTATQSAKSTIYYTPYQGNVVPLYDGANFVPVAFSELSVATTDTTKNPAAIGVSKMNDWFVWNDAGTLRLSHGPDWTSDTARSAGTALVMVNGIWLNNAAIANGPAAQRGTYVGTTRSNGTSTLDWILGTNAAGGGMASLNVWNAYNRVDIGTEVRDSTVTWTYASATVRALNNSATNRINFVSGLAEDAILITANGRIQSGANLAVSYYGVGIDSTTAMDLQAVNVLPGSAQAGLSVNRHLAPQLGYHFAQALEASDGTNTYTFVGNIINQSFGLRMKM